MGAWPDLTEYHEAVQHPQRAFADPGLKVVTLELDRFGMPKPATGGNAVVYKANEPGGFLAFKKTWAIRCFLRPISDHAERYEAISKHLRKVHLPYDVNFQFLKQGIQIRSNWFPIVKMQWAKGDLLHSHIEKHLGYPASTVISWCAADRSSWWTTTACGCRRYAAATPRKSATVPINIPNVAGKTTAKKLIVFQLSSFICRWRRWRGTSACGNGFTPATI